MGKCSAPKRISGTGIGRYDLVEFAVLIPPVSYLTLDVPQCYLIIDLPESDITPRAENQAVGHYEKR
jgi:hypothetical protein